MAEQMLSRFGAVEGAAAAATAARPTATEGAVAAAGTDSERAVAEQHEATAAAVRGAAVDATQLSWAVMWSQDGRSCGVSIGGLWSVITCRKNMFAKIVATPATGCPEVSCMPLAK